MSVKGFKLSNGTVEQYDYNYLANKPSSSGDGLTADVKQAILDCFQNVAWVSEDGQDYYDALYDALYPPANLTSITCVYTQSGTVYDTDTLNSLKTNLVVTAHYDNSTTAVVTNYTLSGTLTAGTSTITVSYGGKTTTFTVTVTHQDSRTKLYDWDFTTGLVDSVQGTTAELSENVTRDSAGLHIPEGKNIVKLANVTLNQYTIEIDVTSVTHATNTDEYNLFCTAQENYAGSRCGLWHSHSSYWGYRLSSNANATNAMENNTDIALFNGKTMKAKIDYTNRSIKVYADDVLVCDFNNHTTPNGRTYVGLGSTYNGCVGSVITACRIYEGVD